MGHRRKNPRHPLPDPSPSEGDAGQIARLGPFWGAVSAQMAISPDGSRLYVTDAGSHAVSVINTTTNSVVATVPVGAGPFGVVLEP